jgi:hypothetical protein
MPENQALPQPDLHLARCKSPSQHILERKNGIWSAAKGGAKDPSPNGHIHRSVPANDASVFEHTFATWAGFIFGGFRIRSLSDFIRLSVTCSSWWFLFFSALRGNSRREQTRSRFQRFSCCFQFLLVFFAFGRLSSVGGVMFVLAVARDVVRIPPHRFSAPRAAFLEAAINEKYANKVVCVWGGWGGDVFLMMVPRVRDQTH